MTETADRADIAVLGSRPEIVVPLSATEARALTDKIIRICLTDLKQSLLAAYEGQAHIALGYESWQAYVEGELGIARSYSYYLVHAARAERLLEEIVVGSPVDRVDSISLSEREVRGLDLDRALTQVQGRLEGRRDQEAVLAVFRQVAEEMRTAPPEPDESVADTDTRHILNLTITQITDPQRGGVAWLWESQTGWNRGWVRIVRPRDPQDILAAHSEIQQRYARHLRGEILEGSTLTIARPRAATHDPVDWQGPIDREGVTGWLAPSGHFYPETSKACRSMISKRRALGLPTAAPG